MVKQTLGSRIISEILIQLTVLCYVNKDSVMFLFTNWLLNKRHNVSKMCMTVTTTKFCLCSCWMSEEKNQLETGLLVYIVTNVYVKKTITRSIFHFITKYCEICILHITWHPSDIQILIDNSEALYPLKMKYKIWKFSS